MTVARDPAAPTSLEMSALRPYWHPVAWSHELGTAPVATVLLDEQLVLWRDGDGVAHCFRDLCLHRGTALSLGAVERDCLVCPYHGWAYASDGTCVGIPQLGQDRPIPASARALAYHCAERHGIVWACLAEEPAAPIADFPEWDDPAYRHVPCPAYTWQTSAPRMVENFTDFGHLGWLHDGLLGTRDDLVVPGHRVETSTDGRELRYSLTMSVPNTDERFAVTDVRGEVGLQTNTYLLSLPHVIWLQCTYHDTGAHRTLFFASQPRSATESTGYCYQSRDFDLDQADQPYADFQDLLAAQDRPIVESQRPHELPVDLAAELHLPFDRVAVAYRRALARLGLDGPMLGHVLDHDDGSVPA